MNTSEKFYKAADLAKNLDVNIMTIYRYIKADRIRAIKIGKEYRIRNSDLNDFLNNSTQSFTSRETGKNEKSKKLNPILKWVGGKRQMLKDIGRKLPETYGRYYEPFLGGGALFFALNPKRATISDLNPELMNVYLSVRDNVDEVIKRLSEYKNEEGFFYETRKKRWEDLNKFEAAARTIFLNRTCFNGLYRVNKSGGFNVPFGKYKNPKIINIENLTEVSNALKNTTIICEDYLKVLKKAKSGDLIFLDPPYLPISEFSDFKRYTKEQFHKEDHLKLADEVRRLNAKGCYIILTNSNSPIVYELYKGFNIEVIQTRRNINSKPNLRKGEDIIVTNF
jgi:DNA adenine methylase